MDGEIEWDGSGSFGYVWISVGLCFTYKKILNLEEKDLGLIVVLWGVYYPMKAFGFLDDEALMNAFDNEEQDDVDIEKLIEDLMQDSEEQQLTHINGWEKELLCCSFQETTCIYSVAWILFSWHE